MALYIDCGLVFSTAGTFFVPEMARWEEIRHEHKDLGNRLNKALMALEEYNPTLAGVLGQFWRRVQRVLPDFSHRKRWLAEHGVELGV